MTIKKENEIYNTLYGDIPDHPVEIIEYILGKKANNKKFNDDIMATAKKVQRMKRTTIEFTMNRIWKPSARPRVNSRGAYMNIYVPHAKENGDWFADYYKKHPELGIVDTPCEIIIEVYEKTPSNFSIKNKVLAELGIIRPWKRTGDFDNYAKSIADAIQHGMLADDCLIYDSRVSRKYSIKPRAVVKITYFNKHPDQILGMK